MAAIPRLLLHVYARVLGGRRRRRGRHGRHLLLVLRHLGMAVVLRMLRLMLRQQHGVRAVLRLQVVHAGVRHHHLCRHRQPVLGQLLVQVNEVLRQHHLRQKGGREERANQGWMGWG